MSAFGSLIDFVDRDAERWNGYPLWPFLFGQVPLALWAMLSDRPPAEGPIWAIFLSCAFAAFWTGISLWRGFRFKWLEMQRIRRLAAAEEIEGSRNG